MERRKTPFFINLILTVSLMFIFISTAGLAAAAERSKPLVKLETSMGEIVLELNSEKAPATAANFLQYVKDGFYDGTTFHRVISTFMIQGGGFDATMQEKPTRAPIKNEANNGLANAPYTIAMARTQDPHSATSQFFINVADNKMLNHRDQTMPGWGYCVFGKVIKGQEVVDKIKAVATATKGMHQNVPVEPVTIIKATVMEK